MAISLAMNSLSFAWNKACGKLLVNEFCSIVRICYRPRLVERALHQKVLLYCIVAPYSFVLQIINQKYRGLVHESVKSCDRLVWCNNYIVCNVQCVCVWLLFGLLDQFYPRECDTVPPAVCCMQRGAQVVYMYARAAGLLSSGIRHFD